MNIAVITLFPEMFDALTTYGVSGRAISRELVQLKCFNPRDYATDKHGTVDDRPYGGGPGMVMKIDTLEQALEGAKHWLGEQNPSAEPRPLVIYLSPQGGVANQAVIGAWHKEDRDLVMIAGRYEGIDERFIAAHVDVECSIGDYVVSGGELPAMVLIDALLRLRPGALGDKESAEQDSFMTGMLDCPHYTRPEVYHGRKVPAVLLSGDHGRIARWRLQQALGRTAARRPDLLAKLTLNDAQLALLAEYRAGSATDEDLN